MDPLISIITTSYNRAKTIRRALDSILRQTYDNYEIIIVEDGSTDETKSILENYNDHRIRIIYHDINQGASAAKNTGLSNIRGEWFTFLDSDDEMLPEALETMMKIPIEMDATVNAISCNCTDTSTGQYSGKGLSSDQYLDFKTIILKCSGEFWGLTKTELLLDGRFNVALPGYEDLLWFKINEKSNRYYIHRALRIYHTDGIDRMSVHEPSIIEKSREYQVLSAETHYLESLKTYLPDKFAKNCLGAVIYLRADKKKEYAYIYFDHLRKVKNHRLHKVISFLAYHSNPFIVTNCLNLFKKAKKIIK